jgi:HAE1 family hydrophobic/amphiphilic exporter-1
VSIPLSLLITFIGLSATGYSLNILTLGALTIAIGRVVDDSIVVIENIKRHLSYGETKITAILTSIREVAGAITASTLTTVAVFLPIAFVGDLAGELFRPFALTVTIALLSSLLVSLTIVPVLAYWFLRTPADSAAGARAAGSGDGSGAGSGANSAAGAAAKAHEAEQRTILQRGYLPVLAGTQRHPVLTLIAAALVLGGTVAMSPLLATDLLGRQRPDRFLGPALQRCIEFDVYGGDGREVQPRQAPGHCPQRARPTRRRRQNHRRFPAGRLRDVIDCGHHPQGGLDRRPPDGQ